MWIRFSIMQHSGFVEIYLMQWIRLYLLGIFLCIWLCCYSRHIRALKVKPSSHFELKADSTTILSFSFFALAHLNTFQSHYNVIWYVKIYVWTGVVDYLCPHKKVVFEFISLSCEAIQNNTRVCILKFITKVHLLLHLTLHANKLWALQTNKWQTDDNL